VYYRPSLGKSAGDGRLSEADWRLTDDQGVERSVTTAELRDALKSGRLASTTLVWREGMAEFQPAFKLPELSGATIAAARAAPRPPSSLGKSVPPARPASKAPSASSQKRSVPPPLPRKSQRGAQKTLTGLEPPELLASLGLNRPPTEPDPRPSASDLPALTEMDGWEDQTDLIPKAPGLPKNLKEVRQLTPVALPEVPAETSNAVEQRTTLLGFGNKSGSVRPGAPVLKPPLRPPARSSEAAAQGLNQAGRSKPPPPKASQPPPAPAGPKRLMQTLEMELPRDRSAAARPQPKSKEVPRERGKPPPPPRGRLTDRPQPGPNQAPSANDAPTTSTLQLGTVPDPGSPLQPSAPEPAPQVAERPHAPHARAATTLMEGTAPAGQPEAAQPSELKPLQPSMTEVLPRVTAEALDEAPPDQTQPLKIQAEVRAEELPPLQKKKRAHRTLEMAIEDHSVASQKDPAPPESLRPRGSDSVDPGPTDSAPEPSGSSQSLDEPAPVRRTKGLEIPVRSILAVSAAWVIGLVIFFVVGRVSGLKSSSESPATRPAIETEFLRITPPEVATAATVAAEPKACWVTRQPSRWAAKADKTVAFDRRTTETTMELGFAVDDKKAMGLRVDPKTGKAETIFEKSLEQTIGRVSPMIPSGAEPNFLVSEKGERSVVPVPGAMPYFLAFGATDISSGSEPGTFDKKIWDLSGEGTVAAEQAVAIGDRTLVAFRRKNQVTTGFIGADGAAAGELAMIEHPEGAQAGKPRVASNGQELAVVFVEKADDKDETPWKLMLARSKLDALPTKATELALPEGGPGGNAIAPDIVGLADGRWLLMWTEGPFEASAIRAQTYSSNMEPIGDPIALSPPAGNFGQALLTVVGSYTTVVFLQAVDSDFELWGAVLRCT
jgi:hypothetical protein